MLHLHLFFFTTLEGTLTYLLVFIDDLTNILFHSFLASFWWYHQGRRTAYHQGCWWYHTSLRTNFSDCKSFFNFRPYDGLWVSWPHRKTQLTKVFFLTISTWPSPIQRCLLQASMVLRWLEGSASSSTQGGWFPASSKYATQHVLATIYLFYPISYKFVKVTFHILWLI